MELVETGGDANNTIDLVTASPPHQGIMVTGRLPDTLVHVRELVREYIATHEPEMLPAFSLIWQRSAAIAGRRGAGSPRAEAPEYAGGLPALAGDPQRSAAVYAALSVILVAKRLLSQAETDRNVEIEFTRIAAALGMPRALAEQLTREIGPALRAIVDGDDAPPTPSIVAARAKPKEHEIDPHAALWMFDCLTPEMLAGGKRRPCRFVKPLADIKSMPEFTLGQYRLCINEDDDDGLLIAAKPGEEPKRKTWSACSTQAGILLRLTLEALYAQTYRLTPEMIRIAVWPPNAKVEDVPNRVRAVKGRLNDLLEGTVHDLMDDQRNVRALIPYCWIRRGLESRQRLPRFAQEPA